MSTTIQIKRPRIALTIGDPSGIGPELVAKLLADPVNRQKAEIRVLASSDEISAAAAEVGVSIPIGEEYDGANVVAVGSNYSGEEAPRGTFSLAGGKRVYADLLKALEMYKSGEADSIMFAPLNKTALHLAGMNEEDELRWFAKFLDFDGFTSELNFVPGLTTSRVTSHIPMSEVAARMNAFDVNNAIVLLNDVIRGSGVAEPRIAVCALNPHGGENGQFGREEIEHITPGVKIAQNAGINVSGPFPADTLFIKAHQGEFDGVVTMYHDQGQIAMKLMGFDSGVTVQGGLPVPIATPAHGTAYEIVGQGIANLGPTQRAFDISVSLGLQQESN
ncbi:4-hydroxythreonine-4-phosphate dehydrogenase PdxA [Jonesiaceae bacterium BS-20]|uniref:4-hydroxythreonine-4-phosphate dehydrogenase PdxA n=1 Tax=Jonesiaceae bacterium BS-20 TaxID=3120821 RepID=A0AAU7DU25_9MICO